MGLRNYRMRPFRVEVERLDIESRREGSSRVNRRALRVVAFVRLCAGSDRGRPTEEDRDGGSRGSSGGARAAIVETRRGTKAKVER